MKKRSGPEKRIKIPDLFQEREKDVAGRVFIILGTRQNHYCIPRGLINYYQMFPFWNTFFRSLDFNVLLSDRTDKEIVTSSLEIMTAETCLPVEVMHGHVMI